MVDYTKLESHAEWHNARGEIERAIMDVLGAMPKERAELQVKTLDEVQCASYIRRRIVYFVDEWTRVTAWLLVPEGRDETPGILCCHQAVRQGKDEAAGLSGDPTLAFAHRYAEMGYVTLAPDSITYGERISLGLDSGDTRSFYKDNPKLSAVGKMLWDHIHAIDALCDFKRVDGARLGVVGHGLGAVNAMMLSAFDERVQTCVASCGFTRFESDPTPGRWCADNGFIYMPKFKEHIKKSTFPFDWEDIIALAAPSYTLLVAALNDSELANTKSCKEAVKRARGVYKLLGASDALHLETHKDGRRLTPDILDRMDQWFDRWI